MTTTAMPERSAPHGSKAFFSPGKEVVEGADGTVLWSVFAPVFSLTLSLSAPVANAAAHTYFSASVKADECLGCSHV